MPLPPSDAQEHTIFIDNLSRSIHLEAERWAGIVNITIQSKDGDILFQDNFSTFTAYKLADALHASARFSGE
jgi:hypothetical protein